MSESISFRDRVAALFKAQPHTWIDGLVIAQVGGSYASRTRISDCRRELGMDIRNRKRRVEHAAGDGCYIVSEYCYVPRELEADARLSGSVPTGADGPLSHMRHHERISGAKGVEMSWNSGKIEGENKDGAGERVNAQSAPDHRVAGGNQMANALSYPKSRGLH